MVQSIALNLLKLLFKGRNKESIKFLFQLVDLKKYPLMPLIEKKKRFNCLD